eukprot:3169914-Heterocapsa_arctica.AAC.1
MDLGEYMVDTAALAPMRRVMHKFRAASRNLMMEYAFVAWACHAAQGSLSRAMRMMRANGRR